MSRNTSGTRIEVVTYNENWPAMFDAEKVVIAAALGDNCVEILHVGSTSVPGLASKPIIDIVIVAKERQNAITSLEKAGYTHKGEWNIPLKCGFTKRGPTGVNLHVFFDKNHPEVELNLRFCDYLRANSDVRDAYAAVKMEILKDEAAHQKVEKVQLSVYTCRKSGFIKSILRALGYDRLRVLKCFAEDEWNTVKALRQQAFFDEHGTQDPYQWTFDHPEHEHFILYHGAEIVGYAHIQLWPEIMKATLPIIIVTEENRNRGFGTQFLMIIEEWLTVHDYKILHVETSVKPMNFYKKHGYAEMPVEDLHLNKCDTPLGKVLE